MRTLRRIFVALWLAAIAVGTFFVLDYGFSQRPRSAAAPASEIIPTKKPISAPLSQTWEQPFPAAWSSESTETPTKPLRSAATERPAHKSENEETKDAPELQAVYTVVDTQPPPLQIMNPADRSYVTTRTVTVRVRSEASTQVEVNGGALAEATPGIFAGELDLTQGLNQLKIQAKDAVGNTSAALLRVTFVEPERIRGIKERFSSLLQQIEEIRAAAVEADQRGEKVVEQINNVETADLLNRLEKELREIHNARRALQKEIESAIQEIDALLAKTP